MSFRIDEQFKVIDNGNAESGWGRLGSEDVVVISAEQPDGTWAFRGIALDEFIFNPRGHDFGQELKTLEQRCSFAEKASGLSGLSKLFEYEPWDFPLGGL